jgi:hypothetical protein
LHKLASGGSHFKRFAGLAAAFFAQTHHHPFDFEIQLAFYSRNL